MKALKHKNINFYKIYNQKPELTDKEKTKLAAIAPVAFIAVATAVVFGIRFANIKSLESEIAEKQAFISDPSVIADYEKYASLLDQNGRLSSISEELSNALYALKSYPAIDSAILNAIESDADSITTLSSFEYNEAEKILYIYGNTSTVTNAALLCKNLEDNAPFSNITYTGYTYGDSNKYYFTMQCVLSPNAVEETN